MVLNGITVEDLQKMIKVRPGPNGNVFCVDESLVGADGRANPALIAPPTDPGEQGQYVYLYGPGFWNADLGLAKNFRLAGDSRINFEALFINAFNHRNIARRQHRRRDVQHRFDDLRAVDDGRRTTRGRFSSGSGFTF